MTIDCACAALDDMERINGHIVIVDNHSDDGSVDVIDEWIKTLTEPGSVSLVVSKTNSGFSGGHNQGIAHSVANFYLILNSDAVLRPGFFSTIMDAARAVPAAGLFTPRIDYDDGSQQTSCFRFPSPASELIRGAETAPITQLLKRYDVPLKMPPEPEQIGWASFACILLRADMIRDVGNMDEGYFLYFEDVEYCWRAKHRGWSIAYVPNAHVVHYRGGSGPVKALALKHCRLPEYYYASRTRVLYQMHGYIGMILSNLMWVFGRVIANFRRLGGKSMPSCNQNETRDIWINTLSPLGDNHRTES